MIIDGKALADGVYDALAGRELPHKPVLGIIVGLKDPVIESFVRIKTRAAERLGVELKRVDLSNPTTSDVVAALGELARESDGIIVQLPLPKDIDVEKVLAAIPKEKDVDAINPTISESERIVRAPVAGAIAEILKKEHVDVTGKKAVVVGFGRLVGKPATALLNDLKANVKVVTEYQGSLEELKDAGVVVLGAGEPGHIRPQHLKTGVVLIDAGTSESSGRVVGDADPACADVASVFTPVPGGVGPIAVSMIFKNLFDLAEKTPRSNDRGA